MIQMVKGIMHMIIPTDEPYPLSGAVCRGGKFTHARVTFNRASDRNNAGTISGYIRYHDANRANASVRLSLDREQLSTHTENDRTVCFIGKPSGNYTVRVEPEDGTHSDRTYDNG